MTEIIAVAVVVIMSAASINARLQKIYDALLTQNHLLSSRIPQGEIELICGSLQEIEMEVSTLRSEVANIEGRVSTAPG